MQKFKSAALKILFPLLITAIANPFVSLQKINFFIPFLVLSLYKDRFIPLLWITFFSGMALDLMSSEYTLGAHTLCLLLTVIVCCRLRQLLFASKAASFFTMGFFLSLLNTLLFYTFFGSRGMLKLQFNWVLTDLLFYPFLEGSLSLLAIFLPKVIHHFRLRLRHKEEAKEIPISKKRPH